MEPVIHPIRNTPGESGNTPQPPLNPSLPPLKLRGGEGGVMSGGGRGESFSCSQSGMALVITLMVLVIITAMVVEFSYAVYTGTTSLYNWRDSQRLSVMAKSGVNVAAKYLSTMVGSQDYSYPGSMVLPVENPFEDFKGVLTVKIEDENSKFNVNALVASDGRTQNDSAIHSFRRLLNILSLDEKIADRIVDWIDKDSDPILADSETGAKNAPLDSVDELLLIKGISEKDYETLLPYVTVYGSRANLIVNINGAEKPVLMCLSDAINDDLAQNLINYRNATPFDDPAEINRVAGFDKIGTSLSGMIMIQGRVYRVTSAAESGGVKRIIQTVLNVSPTSATVAYWKEY
jgi:general secretion pathway protein K